MVLGETVEAVSNHDWQHFFFFLHQNTEISANWQLGDQKVSLKGTHYHEKAMRNCLA
jgi:hypothetical protein